MASGSPAVARPAAGDLRSRVRAHPPARARDLPLRRAAALPPAPRRRRAARHRRAGAAGRAGLLRGRGPLGRARLGHRAVGRRAAGRRGRADRPLPPAAHPGGRSRRRPRGRGARASPTSRVSRAVAPTHFYPPDPSSQIVCSIGGNVAENSGGAHCFKYGFTTNYVIGLEVVLSDGSLVTLDRDAPGYDLLGAFVGSEGTLGVATRDHAAGDPGARERAHDARLLRRHRAPPGTPSRRSSTPGSCPARSR